jgi:uncharacterized protein (TIGR00255 family)
MTKMMSMTGFGRGVAVADGRQVVVEIRSVNHRFLDVKVRGQPVEAACEMEIVRAVRASVRRGALVVLIREGEGEAPGLPIERIRSLYRLLDALREDLDLPGPVDLATVAAFLSAAQEAGTQTGLEWAAVRPALEQALAELGAMREREGAELSADMASRLRRLEELVLRLREASGPLPQLAVRRLEKRLEGVSHQAGVDPGRLAQEIALAADKLDVSEELARLDAHLGLLAALLHPNHQAPEGVGRKLEFLLQEIGRELNTTGAKSQDADVSALVIEAKTELEKIREQAQNIE